MPETPAMISALRRQPGAMSPLQALAAKLWLEQGGHDPDGQLAAAVEMFWRAQPGGDPYWDFLAQRMTCSACGENSRLENLAVCPNCLSLYCYRHPRLCSCGHQTLG